MCLIIVSAIQVQDEFQNAFYEIADFVLFNMVVKGAHKKCLIALLSAEQIQFYFMELLASQELESMQFTILFARFTSTQEGEASDERQLAK